MVKNVFYFYIDGLKIIMLIYFHWKINLLEETNLNYFLKLSIVSVMAAGLLLAGCGTSAVKEKEEKDKETEEIPVKAADTDSKEWKDKSSANGIEKPDFTPTAQGWVAEQLDIFQQEPDSKLIEAGHDKGYDYYLKAEPFTRLLGSYIWVEGVDIEKDFENLRRLADIIINEHDIRSVGTNSTKEWKPISTQSQLAYDYMTQLLNDLNVAINLDGKGETFGVSHQLDGTRVEELESYISDYK